MKIRTGFVTNSSSYSSAVISIQSKELADLLNQYRELFSQDFHDVSIDEDTLCVNQEEMADWWGEDVPTSVDCVLDALMEALNWYPMKSPENREKRSKMFREIKAKKKELTDSLQMVSWNFHDDSYGEFDDYDDDEECDDGECDDSVENSVRGRIFTYDRKTGGEGTYEEYDEELE